MAMRNPANVLPEPVGAATSVCSPSGDGRPGRLLRRRGPVGEPGPEPGRDRRVQLDRRQERGVDRDPAQVDRVEQGLLRRGGHVATLRPRCDTGFRRGSSVDM